MCLFPEGWILEGKCHLDAEDKNQLRKMAFDTRGISAIPVWESRMRNLEITLTRMAHLVLCLSWTKCLRQLQELKSREIIFYRFSSDYLKLWFGRAMNFWMERTRDLKWNYNYKQSFWERNTKWLQNDYFVHSFITLLCTLYVTLYMVPLTNSMPSPSCLKTSVSL